MLASNVHSHIIEDYNYIFYMSAMRYFRPVGQFIIIYMFTLNVHLLVLSNDFFG
jgi:hypothetical protein